MSKTDTCPNHTKPEEWRRIEGFEGIYEVSNLGRVKSLFRIIERSNGRTYKTKEKILKGSKSNGVTVKLHHTDGEKVCLRVSRVVWNAFIGNIPDGIFVLHKDGSYNNNALDNLLLGTNSTAETMKAHRNGGAHPLSAGERLTDIHWETRVDKAKSYVVS
jgi:hypothetical protein